MRSSSRTSRYRRQFSPKAKRASGRGDGGWFGRRFRAINTAPRYRPRAVGRGPIDVFTMPKLADDECPQLRGVILPALEVCAQQILDVVVAEVAAVARALIEQQVLNIGAQFVPKPSSDGDAETTLWPVEKLARKPRAECVAQHGLLLAAAKLQLRR